jgi:hypothetical protein
MIGPAIWLLCLVALYSAHALGCRYIDVTPASANSPVSVSMLTLVLFIAWALFLVGAVILGWKSGTQLRALAASSTPQPQPHRFMARFTFMADASAIAAILATGVPIAAVPACI